MRSDGQLFDFLLELFHGFRPHGRAMSREEKSEELESLFKRSNFRFFWREFQV